MFSQQSTQIKMKLNKFILPILTAIIMSCSKDETTNLSVLTTLKGESGISYNESLSKWYELKKTNGNSYVYQTTFVSWTGFGSITEIKIEKGIVTSRAYQEFKINATNGQREIIDTYTETKANLGSHKKGAAPLTIDDLYNSCASEYLIVDKEKNTLYFDTDKINGSMNLCGFVPKGCADDCFRGIRINSFKWSD
ncbi:hypothetical protein MUN82_19860 [Hymenobacter aerilatus]|uniref:Uncharacterized protein n=1 Tax=Hymenobacter aerilatus TaxID=2932251 RepID=A0A8T9SYA4_9BACT|nr:hypothetical protein [Hymenobacter aerilatus]UOR05180.1 hypothetical protein MUN82_19860 [Hymenobacter aerilatus]